MLSCAICTQALNRKPGARKLHEIWRRFTNYHTSPAFYKEMVTHFGKQMEESHGYVLPNSTKFRSARNVRQLCSAPPSLRGTKPKPCSLTPPALCVLTRLRNITRVRQTRELHINLFQPIATGEVHS